MAVCPNCGAANADNNKFCSGCGAMLPVIEQAQPVQAAQQPVTQPVQPVAAPVYQPAQPVTQPVQPSAAPVYQPAQPGQPVFQPVKQAAPGQKPMIPVVQTAPSAPIPESEVNAVYMQPEYLKTYSDTPRQGSNKYCKTGFTLAIIGLFCMGLTCPFSIVYCIIGFFDARKKQEEGKILAIPGFVISSIIILSLVVTAIHEPQVYTQFIDIWKEIFNR